MIQLYALYPSSQQENWEAREAGRTLKRKGPALWKRILNAAIILE
jgi:hypothetical protein